MRVSSNSTVNDRDDNSDDNGDDNGNDAIKWLWFNENCILRALHKWRWTRVTLRVGTTHSDEWKRYKWNGKPSKGTQRRCPCVSVCVCVQDINPWLPKRRWFINFHYFHWLFQEIHFSVAVDGKWRHVILQPFRTVRILFANSIRPSDNKLSRFVYHFKNWWAERKFECEHQQDLYRCKAFGWTKQKLENNDNLFQPKDEDFPFFPACRKRYIFSYTICYGSFVISFFLKESLKWW